VLILALVGGVFALGANQAHAQSEVDDEVSPLESSTPTVNAVLDAPPTQLQLTFAEGFAEGITAENVGMAISCGGTPLGLGPRALGPDGRTVLAPITQIAPGDPCAVSWRLPSGVVGTFEFTVRGSFAPTTVPGAPTTAPPTTTPGTGPATIVVDPADVSENVVIPGGTLLALARWLSVLGLVALLGTLATAWQTTAELTGRSSTSALSPVSWAELLDDPTGRPVFARLVLVVLLGWVVARPLRAVDPTTQLAAIALPVLAVATYGFSRTGIDNATTVYPAAIVHAVAMAVWLGGLAVTARVVLAKPGEDDLVYALRGYAKLATPAMLIAIVSGVVLSQRLVDGELWSTRHGRWIVLKAVLVGITAYLGLVARRRWRRRLARAEVLEQRLARPMRRALSTELLLGVIILGVTAGLAASRPAAVQPVSPATGYAFDTTLATEGFQVRLSMTPLVAGPQALRAEVLQPEQLESLRITLQPTEVPTSPGWAIDVPLQSDGAAVLRLAQGWRLEVPGVWSVDITARGPTGLLPRLSTSVVIADPLAD